MKSSRHKKSFLSLVPASAFLLAIPLWFLLLAPELKKLPKDFSYEGSLLSIDDFYNETTQEYTGEIRSASEFSYKVVGQEGNVLLIKNTFAVESLEGEKIISVDRLYGIDRDTGAHVAGYGDRNREGYLFAPKNLEKGAPFTYWHVNYDGPGNMLFKGEEILFDLSVLHYEADYQGVEIDQTSNLTHLPDVGVTRGIRVEPHLEVWVEPVSGHLVNYRDESIAYYYDLATGEQLNLWNHFSNTYTLEGLKDQVEIAKQKKLKFVLIDFIVPSLFAWLLLTFVLINNFKRKRAKGFLLAVLFLCAAVNMVILIKIKLPLNIKHVGTVETMHIGSSSSLLSLPIWVAEENGYFDANGIDMKIKKFSSGKSALEVMLQKRENLDLVTVAQTPVVLNSFTHSDFKIVTGVVSSSTDVKILGRRDKGVWQGADLKGKRIGVTTGSTGHYFLGLFLAQHELTLNDVVIVNLPTTALVTALSEGSVDAIASWEPHISLAKKILGQNGAVLQSLDTFREDFYVAAFDEWIENNPELLKRFLKALAEAETFIAQHPDQAQLIASEYLDLDLLLVKDVWDGYFYRLFLDQEILLTFGDQATWAIDNGLVTQEAYPDFLDLIHFTALEELQPEAITIIR